MDNEEYTRYLATTAAWLYYFEEMTQQQIADRLGTTRIRVFKLLDIARQEGLIQFRMPTRQTERISLEKAMMDRFGLEDVMLIPSNHDTLANESVAKAGACYLQDHLPLSGCVNMGYGDTLQRVLNHLQLPQNSQISIVALTGGINYYIRYNELANKGNDADQPSRLVAIPAPLICSSEKVAQILLEEPAIKKVFDLIHMSKVSVVSVGSLSKKATMYVNGHIDGNDIEYLKMKGAMGDVMGQYFDKEGKLVDFPLNRRMIITPLSDLKKTGKVIAVSGGVIKAAGIGAALESGNIHVLVSDVETAEEVLKIYS